MLRLGIGKSKSGVRRNRNYSRDSGERLDAIYDQALREYLKKKVQPIGLKEAFAQSARQFPANDPAPSKKKRTRK